MNKCKRSRVLCHSNGSAWYDLEGEFHIEYSESEWKKEVEKLKNKNTSCNGKIVIVDGKKYKLIEI